MVQATRHRRALVTGVGGFAGSHLADHLLAEGWEVYGFDRVRGDGAGSSRVRVHLGDLLDLDCMREVVGSRRPTHVFHLAALLGSERPAAMFEANVVGTANLFEAVRTECPGSRVLLTSSSAVYGEPSKLPITEDDEIKPTTEYGASKASQEMVAVSHRSRGIDVVRVRPFNLVGPGQPDRLVITAIAKQIAAAERVGGGVVRVGNLRPRRDYLDVRDAVRAYVAVAENGDLGDVYNVCSGRSLSVQECLDRLIRMSSVPLEVVRDDTRVRSHEILEQVGSPARLEAATGWRPRISIDDSLAAVLEYARNRRE